MSVTFTHEIVKGQVDISDVVTVGFSVCLTQFGTLGRDLTEWINRARSTATYLKSFSSCNDTLTLTHCRHAGIVQSNIVKCSNLVLKIYIMLTRMAIKI